MAGLLTGNPGAVAVPSQGVDGWGALFTSDKQMAFAKNLKEGWLTPDELAGVDQWAKETSWLDQQAGRQLSLDERVTLLTELKFTLGMAILGKSPAGLGSGATNPRAKAEPVYKTNTEAQQAAKVLGFSKVNETVHGQAVFKRGNLYITRDLDGHIGGAWKMANSIKALGRKETRSGTYDKNLNRIGD